MPYTCELQPSQSGSTFPVNIAYLEKLNIQSMRLVSSVITDWKSMWSIYKNSF